MKQPIKTAITYIVCTVTAIAITMALVNKPKIERAIETYSTYEKRIEVLENKITQYEELLSSPSYNTDRITQLEENLAQQSQAIETITRGVESMNQAIQANTDMNETQYTEINEIYNILTNLGAHQSNAPTQNNR